MKINFSKKQFENLIKLVYLGNWMINAIRVGDEKIKKYDEIEQYIYSFAKDFGLEKYIEFSKKYNKFFPARELEEGTDVEQYREEYDNETFWEDLIDRLTRRDFIKKYGEGTVKKMSLEERIEKEYPFEEKYRNEFEKNGIENLKV